MITAPTQHTNPAKAIKLNPIAKITGLGFMALGVLLWIIKIFSYEYVDAQGILHEKFYLIPMGFLSFLIGVLVVGIAGLVFFIKKQKAKS